MQILSKKDSDMQHKPLNKFNFSKKQIVEIIGNVASGKTTLSKKLSNLSNAKYIDIDLFITNPFLELHSKDPSRWAFITGLHFSHQRSLQIPKVSNLLQKTPIILDSGFDMGIHVYSKTAFIKNEMTKDEWNLLLAIHNSFMRQLPPTPTTLYIDLPVETILTRIRLRGRNHEQKYYTKSYVKELQAQLDEYIRQLVKSKKRKSIIFYSPVTKEVKTLGKKQETLEAFLKIL